MNIRRRAAMAVAIIAVAFGAGHLMQGQLAQKTVHADLAVAQEPRPVAITPLVASANMLETLPVPTDTLALPNIDFRPADPEVQTATKAVAPDPVLSGDTLYCPVTLDLMAAPKAMIEVTLLAPCRANERLVLRHGGLAITARTSPVGSVFLTLPALDFAGEVVVLFPDGSKVTGAAVVPDLSIYQRFAVQWLAEDAFQVHAFEGTAAYGAPGHVSAQSPHRPLAGIPAPGGFLTLLGDDTVDLPMRAEVYTYPVDPGAGVRVVVEAAVTAATCDRELLGEILSSLHGVTSVADLTVEMPACDAVGDVLVLNNLTSDLKIAATE